MSRTHCLKDNLFHQAEILSLLIRNVLVPFLPLCLSSIRRKRKGSSLNHLMSKRADRLYKQCHICLSILLECPYSDSCKSRINVLIFLWICNRYEKNIMLFNFNAFGILLGAIKEYYV